MLMRIDSLKTSFVTYIPAAYSSIITSRYNEFATRMENNSTHPIVMAIQDDQAYTDTNIP